MAKKSSIIRNNKIKILINKYYKQRLMLKKKMLDKNIDHIEFLKLQKLLANLPRNSSPIRYRNRCSITGRSRAYYRKFGVSRITFRELASKGEIPGVLKSSW